MYSHVIWDIDNTMVSSGAVILRALERLLREEKQIELTEELHQHLVGLPSIGILAHFGFEDIPAAEKRWNEFIDSDPDGFIIFEGVLETVQELKKRGIALGIVSSRTEREMYDDCVKALRPYFDHVILAEDVQHPKPHPEALDLYLARSGAKPEEIIYVGDSPADSMCCEAAGVDFALALWGCIEPEKVTYAKYRLQNPEEVLQLIFGK
ncbi:MAG: HAD family hydrolase [Christensenellales bacterium]|jgi:phosphoglycolate phosphatase-like HAD superfamily hydrolase